MNDSGRADHHLSPDQIAEYLAGGPAEGRSRIEAHLSECSECRVEMVEISRISRDLSKAGHRVWRTWVPVAAAATIALVFVPQIWDRSEAPRLRAGAENGQQIEVVGPADGVSIATDSIAFSWRAVGTGAQYSLNVTDQVGDVVLSEPTADTVLMVHAGLLRPGLTYIWYLDALLPDGESATTGLRRFTIPP